MNASCIRELSLDVRMRPIGMGSTGIVLSASLP